MLWLDQYEGACAEMYERFVHPCALVTLSHAVQDNK